MEHWKFRKIHLLPALDFLLVVAQDCHCKLALGRVAVLVRRLVENLVLALLHELAGHRRCHHVFHADIVAEDGLLPKDLSGGDQDHIF